MANIQQIIAYLNTYKSKYSMQALKNQLIKQGIAPELVDQAIEMIVSPGGAASAQPQQPPQAQPQQFPPAQPPQPATPQVPQEQPPAQQPADASKTQALGPLPEVGGNRRRYILVVDDDPLVRDMISDKLETSGFRVTTADDAAQSVIQAEGMNIIMIVSDIQMPGFGTGVDALKKLRSSPSVPNNLPVVFVTGMAPEEAQKLVPLNDPYVRLLHKPVDWKKLGAYIKELTGLDNNLE